MDKSSIQELRKQAHSLSPVVIIGQNGLTDSVMKEIDVSLIAHELIKIKITGYDKSQQKEMTSKILSTLDAVLVQTIGHIVIIYRDKNTQSPLLEQ